MTAHLRDAHGLLGEDAGGVAIVAVSVDPRRDTAERALEYSTRWQMEDKWAFLVGAEEDLAPIWASYYIAASADTGAEEHTQPSDLGPTAREGVDGYLVSHSAPIYLIDRNGRMRVLFTLPFEPESLVHDIRLLLGR